jgi:DNA-binding CsgD family transcriptional regulator
MELLERSQHLAQLEGHLRLAAAGQGRLVLVGGEAGVGKTSLADLFARKGAEAAEVIRISFDALSTPGPLASARDLAPALGLPIERLPAEGEERDQFFRLMMSAFAGRAEPTVVIGEDAHWADGASLDLLRFLSRRIGDLRLLVVVTYRDDEVGPNHPLRLLLGDLATAPTVHRLSVRPLSEEAVRRMAAGSGRDGSALHRLTGGNPFFLTEVLAAEGDAVPATVEDAILARAARVSPEAKAVLDVAAVIGSPIDLDLLLAVAGPVADQIDAGISVGLVRSVGHEVTFRHDLVREAILGTIAPPRRRLLHARVLAALRETPAESRDAALLAHHAEAAGDREATLEFAVAAAEQAAAMYAHHEAAAQYSRALRFADRLPPTERARLFEGRSIACHLSDQGAEAIAARQAALDIWRSRNDPLKIGESLRWMSLLAWSEADGAEAQRAATAALHTLEPLAPGPELAMAYSNLAQLRMLDDDLEGTLRWGNQAIALAEQLGETETLVHALANIGSARLFAGNDGGEEELTQSLRLALDHGLRDHAGRAFNNLAWASLFAMRLDEADRRFTTALAYTAEFDLAVYHWHILAGRATVRAWQGAWREADTEIRQLLQRPRLSPVNRIMALATLGRVCARRGDPEAAAVLDDALVLAEGTGQLMRLWPVRAARAEAALLEDDRTRARAEARAVRDLVLERGNRWQRGEFAWLLWQAGERDVPADDLAPPFAALIAGDFAAAAAAWHELGCPYEEARALAEGDDLDGIFRAIATFESLGAKPALDHAIRRLRALGVREVPVVRRGPRASTRANPAGLTRREVEVLGLLADGLRNAEIAERLYLSPKTVRHHVSSILGKLGVETRIDAARAASQLGIIAH